jgi:hypothetical protein
MGGHRVGNLDSPYGESAAAYILSDDTITGSFGEKSKPTALYNLTLIIRSE